MKSRSTQVMGIYAYPRGVAFAVFENQQTIITIEHFRPVGFDLGVITKKARTMIAFHEPEQIVLRAFEPDLLHSTRIKGLNERVTAIADEYGIPVRDIRKHMVMATFRTFDAPTKHQRALKLLSWFPQYAYLAPIKRKAFQKDAHTMPLFEAMSLVVAYNYHHT